MKDAKSPFAWNMVKQLMYGQKINIYMLYRQRLLDLKVEYININIKINMV